MRRLAGYTAVALATLTLLFLLWEFRLIVVLFVVSLFVAGAVRPSILRLVSYGLPIGVARLLVYVLLLTAFVLLTFLLSDPFSQEVQLLSNRATLAYQAYYNQWSTGTEWQQTVMSRLPEPMTLFDTAVSGSGEQLLQTLLNVTQALFSVLGGAITVIILSIYWSADQDRFERLWLSLLPPAQRLRAHDSWRELEKHVSDYLRSQFIQSLLAASLLGLGYWVMGLNYPILLAIVAAIAWLIPMAGLILIAVPVFLVGFSESLLLGLGALFYTVAIVLVLEIVVEPRLFNRRRYSTFLLLFTMICLVDAFGFVGFIVAPPLAAAIQVVMGQIFRYSSAPSATATAVHIQQLEQRYQTIQELFKDGEPPLEIKNLLQRLEKLLEQARQLA